MRAHSAMEQLFERFRIARSNVKCQRDSAQVGGTDDTITYVNGYLKYLKWIICIAPWVELGPSQRLPLHRLERPLSFKWPACELSKFTFDIACVYSNLNMTVDSRPVNR